MPYKILDNLEQRELSYYLPDAVVTNKLAGFFSLFSDSSRLRILSALAIRNMCVSDLAKLLNMNQTTLSHQLRLLKDLGAIECERQGKSIFYFIANSKISDVLLFGVEYLGY